MIEWIIVIVLIIAVAAIIFIYVSPSKQTLQNGSSLPTNLVLTNKTGSVLEECTMWDSNGNSYSIPLTYQWQPNTSISFSLSTIPNNGSYQWYSLNKDSDGDIASEYMFYIVSVGNKVFLEYLFGTEPSEILIESSSTTGTYTPTRTFINTTYPISGSSIQSGVTSFPTAVRLTNNTMNALSISYLYVMDSDDNEYIDLESGVVMYPNRKASVDSSGNIIPNTFDKTGSPLVVNLNKPTQIEFTVPITNGQYVTIYVSDSRNNDYTIVLLNQHGIIYCTYPANLDPSALSLSRSAINQRAILNNVPNLGDLTVITSADLPSKKVIVIGSGIAGMTAAELLLNNGYKVTILEARERIGGRIYTDNHIFSHNGQPVPIDVGASWIHGDQNQPLMYLKNKRNIKVWNDAEMRYILNGTSMNMDQQTTIKKAKNTVWNWIEEQGVAPSEFPGLTVSGNPTIKDVMESNKNIIVSCTPNCYTNSSGVTNPGNCNTQCGHIAYNDIWQRACDNSGSNLSDLDTLGFKVSQPVVGKELIVIKGNAQMIEAVSSSSTQASVTLNTEVVNINYEGTEAVVTDKKGNVYSADYVICTIPLGVLKQQNKINSLFTPAWPQEKITAMGKMGFGFLTKYFMLFPYCFWSSEEQIVLLPSDPTTYVYYPSVTNAKTTGLWDTNDLTQWLSDLTNTQLTLVNFAKVTTNDGSAPMLIAMFPADLGWIAERIYLNDLATNQTTLTDMIYARLQAAFGTWWPNNIPPTSTFPTTIPRPTKTYCTRWSTEQYSMGAYSYISTNGTSDDVDILASPLPSAVMTDVSGEQVSVSPNMIQFAGEHTDSKYIATMASAFRAGYIVTNRILVENGKTPLWIPAPPPVPTNVIGMASDGSVSISFTGSSLATSYTVVSGSISMSGQSSPIVVSGLTNGTTYSFTVIANNMAGGSSNSVAISVTPIPKPTPTPQIQNPTPTPTPQIQNPTPTPTPQIQNPTPTPHQISFLITNTSGMTWQSIKITDSNGIQYTLIDTSGNDLSVINNQSFVFPVSGTSLLLEYGGGVSGGGGVGGIILNNNGIPLLVNTPTPPMTTPMPAPYKCERTLLPSSLYKSNDNSSTLTSLLLPTVTIPINYRQLQKNDPFPTNIMITNATKDMIASILLTNDKLPDSSSMSLLSTNVSTYITIPVVQNGGFVLLMCYSSTNVMLSSVLLYNNNGLVNLFSIAGPSLLSISVLPPSVTITGIQIINNFGNTLPKPITLVDSSSSSILCDASGNPIDLVNGESFVYNKTNSDSLIITTGRNTICYVNIDGKLTNGLQSFITIYPVALPSSTFTKTNYGTITLRNNPTPIQTPLKPLLGTDPYPTSITIKNNATLSVTYSIVKSTEFLSFTESPKITVNSGDSQSVLLGVIPIGGYVLLLSNINTSTYIGIFLGNVNGKAYMIPLNSSQGNAIDISVLI